LTVDAPVAGDVVPASRALAVSGSADGAEAVSVRFGDGPAVRADVAADGSFRATVAVSGDPVVHVEALAADGQRDQADVAVVVDQPPSPGTLQLGPDGASAADALVARWVTEPVDPEGALLTTRWWWTRDGVQVEGQGAPTVVAGVATRGQQWTVHAVPHDGWQEGPEATASLTLGDAPPTARVVFEPDPPRAGADLRCVPTDLTDADGDAVTARVSWTVNGVDAGSADTLPASAVHAFDALACTVTPTSGGADGAPVTLRQVALPDLGPGNVLLLVMDDVGAYDVGAYGAGQDPPATPGLDALAAQGVTFTRAWSNPLCSPSRGSIMTGRYPLRTGVGDNLKGIASGFTLPEGETTIPEWLGEHAGYARQAIGKWHLSTDADRRGPTPLGFGFEHYRGMPGNLDPVSVRGVTFLNDYFGWLRWDDDVITPEFGYLTTSEADDAIELMGTMDGPWFLYVAFHAAHTPLHAPPGAHAPDGGWTGRARYKAAVEALDAEIARVVAAAPADTTVIVVGDNGAPLNVPAPPYESWELKGSPMEGGIRVPLIIRSPYVATPGSTVRALVHLVDLLPTVADLARAPVDGALDLDGRSLVPFLADPARVDSRKLLYSERFDPAPDAHAADLWDRAIRDDRYKLVRVIGLPDGCFDLGDDFREGADLYADPAASPEAIAACDALAAHLDADDVRAR
jgi:arylsulfatase A-like enzyme